MVSRTTSARATEAAERSHHLIDDRGYFIHESACQEASFPVYPTRLAGHEIAVQAERCAIRRPVA
jgi:hypothetical protein